MLAAIIIILLDMKNIIDQTLNVKAWPFLEAEKILKKINYNLPKKGYVLFETGYGPSGLPHIGTFGEVVRTTMVRKAFELISQMPTKLFCISDDMDGMRKIPDTIPNPENYTQYLDLPLTSIPDPYKEYESFGHNMNARLRKFLDNFGFEYEFKSATECYKNGIFNNMLLKALERYNEIMNIMLPTLREERSKTYSPFLPICQKTGKVLQVPIIDHDFKNGTISYQNLENEVVTTKVTDGYCKLQWKPDFAMRWAAFDVDFEMYGKDHLINGPIYSKICHIIGGKVPHQMFYELFLDEEGKKISKSIGNGITIDNWLHYAPPETLSLFMYLSPQKAKKLHFEIIPRHVDDYITHLNNYLLESDQIKKYENPVHHIYSNNHPTSSINISYSLILNLASACNSDNPNTIWSYITKYYNGNIVENEKFLRKMAEGAVNYYNDFIKPNKHFKLADEKEKAALLTLAESLKNMQNEPAEVIQAKVYEIGMEYKFELKDWFQSLYEILLGASKGPRFGSFVALYGVEETIKLIHKVIN